jgi:hypothetical protein
VQVWQVRGLDLGDPLGEAVVVAVCGGEKRGERAGEVGQRGHLWAGAGEGVDERPLMVFELVGCGQEVAGQTPGRQSRAVGFDAALGDVAVEQVEAAGVAQFPDLGEELGGADGGVLFPAAAQVLAAVVVKSN